MPQQRLLLSVGERREKHRIFLRDTVALATLGGLVLVFSFVTYFLFHSFATHRSMLEQRWRTRGEASLAAGNPVAALASLHSALAYAPGDRGLQIELAKALAAAGHTQEAQTYFNTLLESEPGSGTVNLQLARLAVRQNNVQSAVDYYQASIDGTWNGDAYTQRRRIRLELSKYLIAQARLPEARDQLLITAGNAPENAGLQMQVGWLLIDAQDSTDALDVFHRAAQNHAARLQALQAEGQTAALLGRYAEARRYLVRAAAEPGFGKQPATAQKSVRDGLDLAQTVLALYPADSLDSSERAKRVAHDAQLAQTRLLSCTTTTAATPGAFTPGPSPTGAAALAPPQRAQLLAGLAQHLRSLNPLAPKNGAVPPKMPLTPPSPASDPLSVLAARWTPIPAGAALQKQLIADPEFAQNTIQLIYSTARATATNCGPLTGEEAALAKIAAAPDQVEAPQ